MFGGHALADTSLTVDVTVQPTRMSGYCHTARNDETTREVGILLLNTNWSYPSHMQQSIQQLGRPGHSRQEAPKTILSPSLGVANLRGERPVTNMQGVTL
jgi:hypothetical protein